MTDAGTRPIDGGCLCGRIRYRLARIPTDVAHCHCRICQRSTGAPVVTWATVPRGELELLGDRPAWHRSSAAARRGFCPSCGAQLFFAFDADAAETRPDAPTDAAETIDVAVAGLDEPDLCRPTRNIWVGSRRAFLHGFDAALPDWEDEGPPTPDAPENRRTPREVGSGEESSPSDRRFTHR